MPEKVGQLYAEGRARITDLVRYLDDGALAKKVPHCPEWTVKELVAHLSGVCADIVNGRLEGVASESWTARQVEERRDWSIELVLDEWNEVAPQCEEIAQHFGGAERQWLGDMVTHEQDIRTALGQPGSRDSEAIAEALPWFVENLGREMTPAFRIVTNEGDDLVMGEGEPTATLRASRFEVFRALTGRRSAEQIGSLDWNGDHGEHLSAFGRGPFMVAATSVPE
jgi:uncharacterized protein (TIGR03083 family)